MARFPPKVIHVDFNQKPKTPLKKEFGFGGKVISLHELQNGDENGFGRYHELAIDWLLDNQPLFKKDAQKWIYQLKYFFEHTTREIKIHERVILTELLKHALTMVDRNSNDYRELYNLLHAFTNFHWRPKGDEIL